MAEPKQRPGRSAQVFSTPDNFIRAVKRRLGITMFSLDIAAIWKTNRKRAGQRVMADRIARGERPVTPRRAK